MTTPADRTLSHADPPEPGSGKRLYVYRPALDGLRALAVLPVLFYHANLDGMSGGFLGVDLFFVLSGYLITTLLILEWAGNGAIRLGPFWGRRARRLLPAMFLVIAAVLVYALFAPAAEVARLRGDAFATLGYVANWWYAVSGESYFEQFGRPSMLRHSWSLAIEEQFYFFWPLLLLFGLKRADSKRRIWIGGSDCRGSALSGTHGLALRPVERSLSGVLRNGYTRPGIACGGGAGFSAGSPRVFDIAT